MSTPEAPLCLVGHLTHRGLEGERAVGQVDGAGSGGLVDPGVALAACWVVMSGDTLYRVA